MLVVPSTILCHSHLTIIFPGIVVQIKNLHNSPSACQKFPSLVESCAAKNIENIEIHQWIITKFPEIFAEYIKYDDTNPFQPLQLQVAIHDFDATYAYTGKLTALVRYSTPYRYLDGSPALLYFVLSKEVAVRAIIGIPTLKQWGSSITLENNHICCSNLKE